MNPSAGISDEPKRENRRGTQTETPRRKPKKAMKKSYLIITAAALLAAASCQKSDTAPAAPETRYNPVDIVLSAAIEGADTKVSYTEDANVLKSAWEKDDPVSLVTYDSGGKVLSNDIFTATEAGASAKFSGTYSDPAGAVAVSVFYPALTEGDGSDKTPWQSKTKMAGTSPLKGVLHDMVKGKEYISVRDGYQLQRGNADLSNVKEAAVMQGVVTDFAALKAGEAKVTLKNICYVIKISAKVPSSVGTVKLVRFQAKQTDGNYAELGFGGWDRIKTFGTGYGNPARSIGLGLGSDLQSSSTYGTGISPDSSGYITAYLVGYTGKAQTLPAGATLEVSFSGSSALSKSSTPLASDLTLEPGKMYRINVDMTK